MTLTEIKKQLKAQYGIDVADLHVLPPNDQILAKRKYHRIGQIVDGETGEVWNVWCNPQVWKKRKQ